MSMLEFRHATESDLPAIVHLLADDTLGAGRERDVDPLPEEYRRAFAAIEADASSELIVATLDGAVVGCLQITIIPGISLLGATRALIEGVRVASERRGQRIGEALLKDAIERARRAGASMVQLSSNVSRVDARRFYERLGFEATHVGMKLKIG